MSEIALRWSKIFVTSQKNAKLILHSIFFLFLLKNIDCGYSLEPPRLAEAVLTCNLQSKSKKNIFFFFHLKIFIFTSCFRNDVPVLK